MTLEAQIDALERLAALDAQLKELEDELSRERDALSGKQTHLAALDTKLSASQKSVSEMEKVRNDLMQELRQMSLQIDRSREKLSRVRTEREANAAAELEELRKLYRDRELEIEKLTALVDQARSEIESTEGEQQELSAELGQTSNEVESRLGGVEKQAAEKYDARKKIVSEIQPTLYRRYELVRKRKGTAIAFTVEGTCSECHMLLPPMMFQKLMRSEEFGQCPSCHRILYFRPSAPAEDGAEAQDTQSSGA